MSNHTPTPWTAHMVNTATVNIRAGEISVAAVYRHIGSPVLHDRAGEGDKNAAFIVRACNSHEALVAALGKALVCLKPQGRPEREGDQYYEVICEIRDVLAGAA